MKDVLDREGKNILFVTYYFPPCGGSGVLRIMRFVKNLERFGWTPSVLTVDDRDIDKLAYGAITVDESYTDAAAKTMVLRTRFVRPSYVAFTIIKGILSLPIALLRRLRKEHAVPAAGVESTRTGAGREGGSSGYSMDEQKKDTKSYYSKDVGPILRFLFDCILIIDQIFEWSPMAIIRGVGFVRKHRIGIVCSSSPPWGVHITALALKCICRTKWVMDLRDPFFGIETEGIKTKDSPWIVRTFYRALERLCMRNADVVVCNCDEIRDYYRSKYAATRFEVVTNGFDPDDFPASRPDAGRRDYIEICHIGELYTTIRTPDAFLEALAGLLKKEPALRDGVSVEILGASEYVRSNAFRGLIRELGIESVVHCHPYVPHREAVTRMISADVLLLLQPHPSTNYQIPAKVYEYIATGNPIVTIAPQGSATFNLVRKHGLGLVSDTYDRNSIECSIKSALEGRAPAPSRESIEYFSAEGTTERFAGIIDGLFETPQYNTTG